MYYHCLGRVTDWGDSPICKSTFHWGRWQQVFLVPANTCNVFGAELQIGEIPQSVNLWVPWIPHVLLRSSWFLKGYYVHKLNVLWSRERQSHRTFEAILMLELKKESFGHAIYICKAHSSAHGLSNTPLPPPGSQVVAWPWREWEDSPGYSSSPLGVCHHGDGPERRLGERCHGSWDSDRDSETRNWDSGKGCGDNRHNTQTHIDVHVINWASVSEPHTNDVNAAFPLYYHHHHGTYVVRYILCLPNLAHCNPISFMLIYFNALDCDHVALLFEILC